MIVKSNKDADFIKNLWMSDEAHFHLNGFVNTQYFHYWTQDNPTQHHQNYFFENKEGFAATVISARYVSILETFSNLNCMNTCFQ